MNEPSLSGGFGGRREYEILCKALCPEGLVMWEKIGRYKGRQDCLHGVGEKDEERQKKRAGNTSLK